MNSGLNVQDLAAKIMADRAGLKDYLGDTTKMMLSDSGRALMLETSGEAYPLRLEPTDLFHEQLAEKNGIPAKYYDRMRRDNPELLLANINSWFHREPAKRLVRTTNGRARAFLSDGYRPLDNYDVAENILPVLASSGLTVVSSQITESRLYIQAVSDRLSGDVKVGDTVQGGITIRNSEVGKGSLAIEELVWRLVCKNGMVGQNVLRQSHVGGTRKGDVTFAEEISFSTETRKLSDRAFWAQARDAVAQILQPGAFAGRLELMKRAVGIEIAKPAAAIEAIGDDFDLNVAEREGVLASLIKGADLSVWGLLNAVTAQAHDAAPDRAYELEKIGGKILELPRAKFLDLN